MKSQEQARNAPDPQRTLRLRDNKRRSRLRQKQCIADLEGRLRQLQREGVKATKEVQESARRVVQDNIRLRALLRYKGVDDETIDTWSLEGMTCEHKRLPWAMCDSVEVVESVDPILPVPNNPISTSQPAAHEIDTKCENRPSQNYPSKSCQKSDKSSRSCPDRESPAVSPTAARSAPCKLISRLAENPSTDVTQILVSDHETDEYTPADGVECSKAYQMLMQFATTEERLDTICRALEDGCTVNEGPRSGCMVRNETIWKAIDDLG